MVLSPFDGHVLPHFFLCRSRRHIRHRPTSYQSLDNPGRWLARRPPGLTEPEVTRLNTTPVGPPARSLPRSAGKPTEEMFLVPLHPVNGRQAKDDRRLTSWWRLLLGAFRRRQCYRYALGGSSRKGCWWWSLLGFVETSARFQSSDRGVQRILFGSTRVYSERVQGIRVQFERIQITLLRFNCKGSKVLWFTSSESTAEFNSRVPRLLVFN